MCMLWFSLISLSEKLLILIRIERDYHKCVYCRSTYKVIVIIAIFSLNLDFLARTSKNTHISNFMKIHWVGVELLQADTWTDTDMMKLIAAFRSFATMPIIRVFFNIFEIKWHNSALHQLLAIRKMWCIIWY